MVRFCICALQYQNIEKIMSIHLHNMILLPHYIDDSLTMDGQINIIRHRHIYPYKKAAIGGLSHVCLEIFCIIWDS